MKQIVAIGGGGFGRLKDTLAMEEYILSLTDKSFPKICMLPQASCEDQAYVTRFYEVFLKLNAKPSWQSFFGVVAPGWQEKLLAQDIIYVGGGNTKTMLAIWKAWGVEKILREAYEKGIVLCGVSAGAICWFKQGITDSVWPLGVLDCMNFLDVSCCPHYDSEPERKPMYIKYLKENAVVPGYALEDNTAVHFVDGKLKQAIKTIDTKSVYKMSPQNQEQIAMVKV